MKLGVVSLAFMQCVDEPFCNVRIEMDRIQGVAELPGQLLLADVPLGALLPGPGTSIVCIPILLALRDHRASTVPTGNEPVERPLVLLKSL